MEAKKSPIELDDDDDDHFFSLAAAAEADALASKRRRITPPSGNAVVSIPASNVPEREGLYMAALKGDQSLVRPRAASNGRNDAVSAGGVGGGGGDSCFKCGKSGHWARDCGAVGGGGQFGNSAAAGSDSEIAEKSCPCGLGICLVLTANTEKNRGRKFYKCPLRQENGGCGFFEWCDSASGGNSSMAGGSYGGDSSHPGLQCPCGGGLCVVLTAKTGKNIGQQFYRCPSAQGSSCGFFKWCNENTPSASLPTTASKAFYNSTDTSNTSHSASTGSSCFKCGKEGHWARDCSSPSSNPTAQLGARSVSTGTRYKCGKAGHWSRDCSFS